VKSVRKWVAGRTSYTARSICATLLAILIAGVAPRGWAASGSDLEAAFGNTIVSTYANGDTAKLWLERNGRYRGSGL
jgi:hypothetical protein